MSISCNERLKIEICFLFSNVPNVSTALYIGSAYLLQMFCGAVDVMTHSVSIPNTSIVLPSICHRFLNLKIVIDCNRLQSIVAFIQLGIFVFIRHLQSTMLLTERIDFSRQLVRMNPWNIEIDRNPDPCMIYSRMRSIRFSVIVVKPIDGFRIQ